MVLRDSDPFSNPSAPWRETQAPQVTKLVPGSTLHLGLVGWEVCLFLVGRGELDGSGALAPLVL